MRRVSSTLILPVLLSLGGCAVTGLSTHPAVLGPGVVFDDTTVPIRPEEQMKHRKTIRPTKGGRACSYSILGIVSWGDSSFGKAVRAGDISTVSSVDTSHTGVPILQSGKVCTVVEGN